MPLRCNDLLLIYMFSYYLNVGMELIREALDWGKLMLPRHKLPLLCVLHFPRLNRIMVFFSMIEEIAQLVQRKKS